MHAFAGLTVVDFTQLLSSPMAGQLLALIGAEGETRVADRT